MRISVGIGLLSTLLLFSCHWLSIPPKDSLPAITREGKNTFGCQIDDRLFLPSTTLFGNVHPLNCYYYTRDQGGFRAGSLYLQGIDARYELSTAGNVAIQVMDIRSTGTYALTYEDCPSAPPCNRTFYYNSDEGTNYFATRGELVLTRLDTVARIASGTFWFDGQSPAGKTRRIRSGRFDVRYSQ